ncbi:hypothetical protein JZ751_004467 [Albula glossodonta]|uniref:Cytochrome P450 n=1 Tax=Albula glossodonta TaxID=121402 RepID=A0A8T2N5L2_9TELE|nr:hypothetical protein JZ751_004467 [Albula glossodonta]
MLPLSFYTGSLKIYMLYNVCRLCAQTRSAPVAMLDTAAVQYIIEVLVRKQWFEFANSSHKYGEIRNHRRPAWTKFSNHCVLAFRERLRGQEPRDAAISTILFETRLGCMEDQIPPDTQRFIAAVGDMLALSETVLFFPRWTRGEKISLGEVYISLTELLLGGVDTVVHSVKLAQMQVIPGPSSMLPQVSYSQETSNTMSWTLYHLARNEAAQDRLYQEVISVCPGKQLPTTQDLTRMPYLKAVIKETLRMYPVVPGNGRLTLENEVVVDNYWFPKNTQFHLCHYAASHDEAEFPEPERFYPERWLRGTPSRSQHHPYSSIPFGVGVRACVGKRVAELEMYFALTRMMQRYKIQQKEGAADIKPKTRTLLVPSKPIDLRFVPRA